MTTPDYKRNDPKGWCGDPSRGAALGRPAITDAPKDQPIKLHLQRVYLNLGGYDKNGTYFGHGEPLFWVSDDNANVDYMLRVYATYLDRTDLRDRAKELVRKEYPKARFYR